MAKQKNLVVVSTATLIEIVKGEKVERVPGTPVSLPFDEAGSLIARKLATPYVVATSLPSPLPGDDDDGDGSGDGGGQSGQDP